MSDTEIKIPPIRRYKITPHSKGFRVFENIDAVGKWVRFSDIEWILLNLEPLMQRAKACSKENPNE